MKKYLFAASLAVMALTACTSENDLLESPPSAVIEETEAPILFSSTRNGTTRANEYTGATAADLLGGQFVVSGYKGTSSATVGNIVFDNYAVKYEENTAHTTESNTANWEYVNVARIQHAIDNGITRQTIKYWDYTQPQYDFIAWSTGKKTAIYSGTPTDGEVLVSAITPSDAKTAAYTFEGKAADLRDCYIADLVTVKKSGTPSENVYVGYGNTVTLKFRQLGTKVRIGIYETVPGYSVRDVKFYTQGGVLTDKATQIQDNAVLFTAAADIYTEGTYTVFYPTVDTPADADNNQAHVTFAPKSGVDQTTTVNWGTMNYTIAEDGEKTPGSVYLGRTSSTASFAGSAEDNYYVTYLPNQTGTNLNLRVDFTLESIDGSGETIEVKNASAQVPLTYTQWKPGYAYTYLFKISDKTNGRTGNYDPTKPDDDAYNSDPAGLYPITFDAVVVNAEDDFTQETITTVTTPSITTYQKASTVTAKDEYTANGNDIFVTVSENDALVALTSKAALYTLPAGHTEAEVVDALSMQDDDATAGTIKGRSGLVLANATSALTDKIVTGADGNEIALSTDQALKFTPAASTTYAFVYTKTAATTTTDMFEAVTLTVGVTIPANTYRYALKAATAGDVQKGVTYFGTADASTDAITAFLGQTVGNLYLDATGTTIASGYAVTGTTYYYTVNGGMSYKAAHNVAYADFATAELYTEASGVYTAKTETAPVSGTAYYYKESDGSYTYCVLLPQQTTSLYVIDDTTDKVAATGTAVKGMTYFDKYTKNDGVYYTKIIKVQ